MIFGLLKPLVISAAIFLLIALALTLTQRPGPLTPRAGLDFTNQLSKTGEAVPLTALTLTDGYDLQHRVYPGPEGGPLLILVHGSGWHGLQFDELARQLQTQATVVVPDLRGHGTAPGRRGDVDYIGQFEDDLAEVIAAYRTPGQKVVMGGHSSGGGLVVRFAGGAHGALLNGAVLLAPFLQYDAPSTRENSGGWTEVVTGRMIGLSMLNMVGIRAFNHLKVIQFHMPKVVLDGPLGDTATTAYSYRLNTGFSPRRDYKKDIAALPPFVLIAGQADEAFVATAYEDDMGPGGTYVVVPEVGHLDIVDHPETADRIGTYLDGI